MALSKSKAVESWPQKHEHGINFDLKPYYATSPASDNGVHQCPNLEAVIHLEKLNGCIDSWPYDAAWPFGVTSNLTQNVNVMHNEANTEWAFGERDAIIAIDVVKSHIWGNDS